MLVAPIVRLVTALAAIHGTVRVAGHGIPLGGVAISIDGVPRARTDSIGGYAIDSLSVGSHEFRFTALGYDARRVTILLEDDSDLSLDIELTPHPITLPPIEVIARPTGRLATIEPRAGDGWRDAGRYRFDAGWQLRHPASGLDLLQTIATVPGVTTRSDNALGVSIHGGRGSENLVLLDGIPLLGAVHFGGASSAIAPESIARFDIHTGVAPARFGDALAGVIELQSADAVPATFSFAGAVSSTDLRSTLRLPLGTTGGLLVGARSSFRNLLTDEGGLGFDNGYQDGIVTGHLPLGAGTVRLLAFGSTNRVRWRTTATEADSSVESAGIANTADWRSAALGASWRVPVGPGREWRTSAWWSGTDARIALVASDQLTSGLSSFGIRSEAVRPLRQGILLLGGTLQRPNSHILLANGTDSSLAIRHAPLIGALYGEWELTAESPWSVRTGLRVESDFRSLVALDPRIVVRWQTGDRTRLTAGYGRSHQPVQSLLNEDNVGSAVIGPTLPVASGPDGPIARSEEWTAGFERRIGHGTVLALEGYHRDWHDVLTPSVTSGGLYGRAPALGDGHAEGGLATLTSAAGRFALRTTIGLGRSIQRSGDLSYPTGAARPWSLDGDVSYQPADATLLQLRWTTGAGQSRSVIAAGIEWQPYQPGTGSGEFEGNPTNLPGAINALRLSGPLRIDVGVRHSWSLGASTDRHAPALITSLRVHNLLNRTDPIGVMARPDGSYQWLRGTPRGLIAELGWRY